MLELAAPIGRRLADGHALAVATVVNVVGSAPRAAGATMFVDDAGTVVGSVSGGCVEGAVVEACEGVLVGGAPTVVRFGISDDEAMRIGLSCGGDIDVLVRRVRPGRAGADYSSALDRAGSGCAAAVATVVSGPEPLIGLGLGELTDELLASVGAAELSVERIAAERDARLAVGRSGTLEFPCADTQVDIFFDVAVAPARMIIFGAVDFSAALADAAKLLGYRVTVCDARALFATPERFPSADEVVVEWPDSYLERTEIDSRTVLAVLTHDAKFDIPLLRLALELPVAFVGAMGSRRTHERRVAALREEGVTDEALGRLHSPFGLDLGASSPQETAVSMLAEVIASRTGRAGDPLRAVSGPIHRAMSEAYPTT
jgi:xanthine dehydrogenase accessory factor